MHHTFIDQPIKLLRHQSAGHPNFYETSAVSLFAHILAPALLMVRSIVARTSRSQSHLHVTCFAFFPMDSQGKERPFAVKLFTVISLKKILLMVSTWIMEITRYVQLKMSAVCMLHSVFVLSLVSVYSPQCTFYTDCFIYIYIWVIDKCEVKMAGYWLTSFFVCL